MDRFTENKLMTKTEALNKAAQEFGYADWGDVNPKYNLEELISIELKYIVYRAMDIYAGEQAKKAISVDDAKVKYYEDKIEMMIRTSAEIEKAAYNQAIRDAAESALIKGEFPNGTTINGDDVVIPEGEIVDLKISVSKQSILKLLK